MERSRMDEQLIAMLNANAKTLARIDGRLDKFEDVFMTIHRRLGVIEECLESVARDAAEARFSGLRVRDTQAAIARGVQLLIEDRQGRSRSSATLEAAKVDIGKTLDGKR